ATEHRQARARAGGGRQAPGREAWAWLVTGRVERLTARSVVSLCRGRADLRCNGTLPRDQERMAGAGGYGCRRTGDRPPERPGSARSRSVQRLSRLLARG